MEITGHKIGTVGNVAHNLPAKVQHPLEVWLLGWDPIFSINPFRSIQLTNEINIKSLPPLYRRLTPFSCRPQYKPWYQILKCRWWLHGGLMYIIWYLCAMYIQKSEGSSWHQRAFFLLFVLISYIYQSTCHNAPNSWIFITTSVRTSNLKMCCW